MKHVGRQNSSDDGPSQRLQRAGAALLAVALAIAPLAAAELSTEISDVDEDAGDALSPVDPLLNGTEEATTPLPDDPQEALIDRTETLSAELGFEQDAREEIESANLTDEVAGRLANVLDDMLTCYRITDAHWQSIPHDEASLRDIWYTGGDLDPSNFTDVRECALDLKVTMAELNLAITPPENQFCDLVDHKTIDVWPVIKFEGACTNTDYLNDYLLIVDLGGHESYVNNIGSNMVDLNYAPPTSDVPGLRGFGPAQGCQMAIPGLANANCLPATAVLLDVDGEDTFGVKQTPDVDDKCTADPVIRRMVVGAVGFMGVGILMDAAHHPDNYTGKTVSLGAGHIFGVGLLIDNGGNDDYHSVRNSQGFALVGGVGIIDDRGGNDRYDYYMPDPLDPSADNEEDGAGGVVDDVGNCDNRLRFLQGAGNVAGPTVGLLLDESGQDTYVGGFSNDFEAPAGTGRGGSQGFGNNGGFGILVDQAGSDSYTIDEQTGSQGTPTRDDGTIIAPGEDSTGPGGVFIDEE